MEPKVIFLQGPPGAGKDAIGSRLVNLIPYAKLVKFAGMLKDRTHALFGLFDKYGHLPAHAFDATKDEPSADFMGLTPRQAYIWLSEQVIKPKFGADFFGRALLDKIRPESREVYIVTDSGFAAEATPVIERVGPQFCAIVQIHRYGHDFSRDSRSYWTDPAIRALEINNNTRGSEALYRQAVWLAQTLFPSLTDGPIPHESSSCAGPRPASPR